MPCVDAADWTKGAKLADTLLHFLAPLPLLLVLGGSLIIALLQQGRGSAQRALSALIPLFNAAPDADRDHARAVLLRVDEVAQLRGISRTDRVRAKSAFLADAIQKLANCNDYRDFDRWARQDIGDRGARHRRAIDFWNSLADTAPAMGMAGTVIGLIGMFANMDDPASLGPSMALALLTTLHGIVLANLMAGPIAQRLARLSREEIAWQTEVAERISAIARRESAPLRQSAVRDVA